MIRERFVEMFPAIARVLGGCLLLLLVPGIPGVPNMRDVVDYNYLSAVWAIMAWTLALLAVVYWVATDGGD